jgi:asparagine synthase (glutamine-hydrolysing)
VCGIAGFFSSPGSHSPDTALAVARRMGEAIGHRGPDSAGGWHNGAATVAFGHRRLAIVDLSAAGAQPMSSRSARYQIAFNGEIYNHLELRDELRAEGVAPQWRGHSDTETLLAGFEQWGVQATLVRAVGMFAIALWDHKEEKLFLIRDRFGEKPLYFGWPSGAEPGSFAFGSELKALRAYPGFSNPISREALARYMRFMYVPAPYSIYEGVYKLEAGCILSIRHAPPSRAPARVLRAGATHDSLSISQWWSFTEMTAAGLEHPLRDETEALAQLEKRIGDAVRLQSLADVPLGAFLSGGVDSSTIVAFMQEQSTRPVKTFTVGFEDAGFDESPHARAVARHLGTEHHELFVTADETRSVIPGLPSMYDEPFADSSQIPTYLVCQAARRQVTVALSGDAGDELFGGYNRYFWAPRIWKRARWLPYPMRQLVASGLHRAAPQTWDRWLGRAGVRRPGEKLHKLAAALDGAHTIDELYGNLATEWHGQTDLVRGASDTERDLLLALPGLPRSGIRDPRARMMFWDSMTYLPDDILCKVDRAAMATSLETRVPFLDHRVAELAWRLPLSMKIRGAEGKWALRQVLYRRVPRQLIERPKTGFSIPVGQWLLGPLREWAETLLSEERLRRDGYLNPAPIRQAWAEHLSRRYDRTARLWTVLMFQAWLDSITRELPAGCASSSR